jgi:UDP-glucose 4-epimerase
MRALVTGGAGYIGSFVVRALQEDGHDVVVLDNLTQGHRDAIDCPLVEADLTGRSAVHDVLRDGTYDSVLHFAASASVRDSVADPAGYFRNNTVATLNLLDACAESGIERFVFSSTSEVYGEALYLPLDEEHPTAPVNPYGLSKRMVEQSLEWYDRAYGLRSISLRYFNAAGAALDGSLGEDHRPEEHLVANAARAALGLQDFKLTSAKVDTPDGTTIRDYIHVLDLAEAHVRALEILAAGHPTDAMNLGSGHGYSTREVVETVQRLTGASFPIEQGEVRQGEPAAKYASYAKAERLMGWRPRHDLETIIASALEWHRSHPHGYAR